MPTLDDMFGKPKETAVAGPTDILPTTHATNTAGVNDTGSGRDVLLVGSPFEPEAVEFFNRDAEARSIEAEAAPAPGPFPALPSDLDALGDPAVFSGNARVDPTAARSGVDALTEALGPSIENLSRFGEFGGGVGPSSELSQTELKEALRAVLKRL